MWAHASQGLDTLRWAWFAVGYTERVVVIGAGISGLACAYRLKQLGLAPRVFEATKRAGGLIATLRRDGLVFEAGPQCPRFPPSVWRLVRELNLEGEFVPADAKAKRYVFKRGRLHLAPFSPTGLVATRLVGLQSKLRILTEPFGYSQPPEQEESLADFVERKFGREVLDNLVDPFISTIFFGDASKMGMKSAFPALVEWERRQGSLVRGALRARKSRREASKTDGSSSPSGSSPGAHFGSQAGPGSWRVTDALPALGSFKSGMAALPEKLSSELKAEILYGAKVTAITPIGRGDHAGNLGWQVSLPSGEQIRAEHLVLATPAHVAAELLEGSARPLASQLQAIEYAPIGAVSSAYHKSQVTNRLDGFGFMVPRCERLTTICTFWNSSLFREHARDGVAVITSFARREGNDAGGSMTDEEFMKIVEEENARILRISGQPLDRAVWKDPPALPQYNVGHANRVSEIYGILPTLPNLYLAGNFLTGRSIGDCVDIAFRVAEDLNSQLQR